MGRYIYEEYVSIFRTAQGAMATNYQMLIWSLLGDNHSLSVSIQRLCLPEFYSLSIVHRHVCD